MSDATTFTVNGVEYPFAQDLTLGEARSIKLIYGVLLGEMQEMLNRGDQDAIAATVWVSMRRVDPSKTEADVDLVNLTELAAKIAEPEAAEATTPEDDDVPLASAAAE